MSGEQQLPLGLSALSCPDLRTRPANRTGAKPSGFWKHNLDKRFWPSGANMRSISLPSLSSSENHLRWPTSETAKKIDSDRERMTGRRLRKRRNVQVRGMPMDLETQPLANIVTPHIIIWSTLSSITAARMDQLHSLVHILPEITGFAFVKTGSY